MVHDPGNETVTAELQRAALYAAARLVPDEIEVVEVGSVAAAEPEPPLHAVVAKSAATPTARTGTEMR
jgi:hypothetical protein